jgi:hypothetical protein
MSLYFIKKNHYLSKGKQLLFENGFEIFSFSAVLFYIFA